MPLSCSGRKRQFSHLFTALTLALLLGACSGDAIVRGKLDLDLRSPQARTQVNWPKHPNPPRFRYAGELVGEPNFVDFNDERLGTLKRTAIAVGKWIAGLLSTNEKVVMARPIHGFTDASGRIFVVDAGRAAILAFMPQAIEGRKGEGEMLVWTAADQHAELQSPIAITGAWNGTLAVSDAELKAVYLLNDKGEPIGKLGAGLLGRPTGLAFDSDNGLLYVADTEASDIKVFDRTGQQIRTIGAPGDGTGELNAPTHLSFADGTLYVSDSLNNRLQAFSTDGSHRQTTGEAGIHVGQFSRPKGIAYDARQKLVYAIESYFAHLLVYDDAGLFLLGIDGSGLPDGRFALPAGVWLGGDNKVFVADMYNNRVVVFERLPPPNN